jgi:SAM-dependent methyltransferase
MAKSKRKQSNELEFQGQVIVWLNEEIQKRPGLQLDKATQEKPRQGSGKRNDLVVWTDRSSETAFLSIELKTPTTPINDPEFFADALEKGRHWKARYFALWNMRELEVYATPPAGHTPLPTEAIRRSSLPLAVTQVEDWLKPAFAAELHKQGIEIIDAAINHHVGGGVTGHTIEAVIFVSRLTDSIGKLRGILYRDLTRAANASRKLTKQLNKLAAEQGFKGFVQDINYAIAGQIGYRFIGQILFYFALRRKIPSLKEIKIAKGDQFPAALEPYWNDVRRYDYEALFKPDPIETLIPIAKEAQVIIRQLIEQLASYDWASLTDDVLGSIFEHLIPREEQILLGQFYTPRPVSDLLAALTIDGKRPLVLDPGCGSGTFLMSAYGYLAHTSGLSHKELLSIIWGFDISPFAAELAVINLYRQDMSEYENFPRIVPGNFFERIPGQTIEFPAPQRTSGTKKIPVPIPIFDCVIGNPPYLRSQNQDDLDPDYRSKLFLAAAKANIQAPPKTDLFAFFIYHALRLMKVGSRLGFVTPASWLTADYATSLQHALLGSVRLSAVVSSNAESFFPQVDINTVLLVAERAEEKAEDEPIRFVTLKMPITQLTAGKAEYWARVTQLAREIEESDSSIENDRFRIKLVDPGPERAALKADRTSPRNWSKYLRAPLSYYEIFEGEA